MKIYVTQEKARQWVRLYLVKILNQKAKPLLRYLPIIKFWYTDKRRIW